MTDWRADRERYERENPQWKIIETQEDAFKRLEKKDIAAWRKMALAESREEFYNRISMAHPSLADMCERRLNKTKKKRGPTKEVLALRAKVKELEGIVAKLMGDINA